MKLAHQKVTPEKAKEELRLFSLGSLGASIASLVLFPVVSVAGIAFGARALLMSIRVGKTKTNLEWGYTVCAAVGLVLGVALAARLV